MLHYRTFTHREDVGQGLVICGEHPREGGRWYNPSSANTIFEGHGMQKSESSLC